MNRSLRDQVYRQPLSKVGDFRFDAAVADVFEDMIARSVPGYGTVLAMIPTLARRFVTEHSQVYDLGCSLGAASFAVANSNAPNCTIIAVDNSVAMVERLRDRLDQTGVSSASENLDSSEDATRHPIDVRHQDLESTPIEDASFVMLNYTMQFIAPEKRTAVLAKIFDGIQIGGAILLSEKIHLSDDRGAELLSDLHHDFKRAQGYSDLEISQKRTALENTLVTETVDDHLTRLSEVGFQTVVPWFACLGFVSILAIKT